LNSVVVCITAFLRVELAGFMMLMVSVTGAVVEAGDGLKKTLKLTAPILGVGVGVVGDCELVGVDEVPGEGVVLGNGEVVG
jgi:hypothetical protein